MSDSTFQAPLNRRLKRLIDGLTYQAIKVNNNWMLPLGKDAAAGEAITVDGILGYAIVAIVGGTDAIVENTNWVPYGDGGALNSNIEDELLYSGTLVENQNITLEKDMRNYKNLAFVYYNNAGDDQMRGLTIPVKHFMSRTVTGQINMEIFWNQNFYFRAKIQYVDSLHFKPTQIELNNWTGILLYIYGQK